MLTQERGKRNRNGISGRSQTNRSCYAYVVYGKQTRNNITTCVCVCCISLCMFYVYILCVISIVCGLEGSKK